MDEHLLNLLMDLGPEATSTVEFALWLWFAAQIIEAVAFTACFAGLCYLTWRIFKKANEL